MGGPHEADHDGVRDRLTEAPRFYSLTLAEVISFVGT